MVLIPLEAMCLCVVYGVPAVTCVMDGECRTLVLVDKCKAEVRHYITMEILWGGGHTCSEP